MYSTPTAFLFDSQLGTTPSAEPALTSDTGTPHWQTAPGRTRPRRRVRGGVAATRSFASCAWYAFRNSSAAASSFSPAGGRRSSGTPRGSAPSRSSCPSAVSRRRRRRSGSRTGCSAGTGPETAPWSSAGRPRSGSGPARRRARSASGKLSRMIGRYTERCVFRGSLIACVTLRRRAAANPPAGPSPTRATTEPDWRLRVSAAR